jgi:hypothetical protein
MAFKVNYGLERAERNRAKQAKKEAKAKAKKAGGETETANEDTSSDPASGMSPLDEPETPETAE